METPYDINTLVALARRIPPIDRAAAGELGRHRVELVAAIDRKIFTRQDLAGLRVHTRRDLLENKHRNHVELVHNVAALNAFELLARTLPWSYATYESHGLTSAYFLAVVEAGREAMRDALSPATFAQLQPLHAFIVDAHAAVEELSRGPAAVLGRAPAPLDGRQAQVLALLLDGDHRGLARVVRAQAPDADGLLRFYLDVLPSVMEELGALWQRGRISVADEHLATSLASRVIAQLYASLPEREPVPGKVAVVACAPGETHELAGRMLTDLLEAGGWDVSFIGAGVPAAELLHYVGRRKPFLLCLSVTMPLNLQAAAELTHELRGEPDWERLRVLLGGRAFALEPALAHRMGADGWADSVAAGVHWAESWWEARDEETFP